MNTVTNALILKELWEDDKVSAVNAKSLIKNIKAAQRKPTKKDPNRIQNGEVTLVLPEEFIGENLRDAWGGKDAWFLFKINPDEWNKKKKELQERLSVEIDQ